jgi:hypothetical protein
MNITAIAGRPTITAAAVVLRVRAAVAPAAVAVAVVVRTAAGVGAVAPTVAAATGGSNGRERRDPATQRLDNITQNNKTPALGRISLRPESLLGAFDDRPAPLVTGATAYFGIFAPRSCAIC